MQASALTLARWHGATPSAVDSAGPAHGSVLSDHHVARLAHEGHVLAHCHFVPDPQTVGWNAGVTTGDHCLWQSTTTGWHQAIVSAVLRNNSIGQGLAILAS